MKTRRSLERDALFFAATSGTIMPLSNWLGGIMDYAVIAVFLLLSVSWVLAFVNRNSVANPVSLFKLTLSGCIGIMAALFLSWAEYLIYHKNWWLYINYVIYLVYGFLELRGTSSIDRGGYWLSNIRILSSFLVGYAFWVLILYHLYAV